MVALSLVVQERRIPLFSWAATPAAQVTSLSSIRARSLPAAMPLLPCCSKTLQAVPTSIKTPMVSSLTSPKERPMDLHLQVKLSSKTMASSLPQAEAASPSPRAPVISAATFGLRMQWVLSFKVVMVALPSISQQEMWSASITTEPSLAAVMAAVTRSLALAAQTRSITTARSPATSLFLD